jgi:hypothetical protein
MGICESYQVMTLLHKCNAFLLLLMTLMAFVLFSWPNSVASENLALIQMFQPDEATPLPYVFHMIAPAENVSQTLRSFVFYEYYYYDFPYFGLSAAHIITTTMA